MDEDDLKELLDFVRGEGKFASLVSGGMRTFPEATDANNVAIHSGMLELEKRGLVRIVMNNGELAVWEAVGMATDESEDLERLLNEWARVKAELNDEYGEAWSDDSNSRKRG